MTTLTKHNKKTPQTVYFVTGTDTDVGKTYVSKLLLQHLNQSSTAIGYKPIAAGAEMIDGELKNEDALILETASATSILTYNDINPICYKAPIAPHIASDMEGDSITINRLTTWWEDVKGHSDAALIEGAGGWRLPINNHEHLSSFVKVLQCEVIVVVGMKLGCLNHVLLTMEAIKQDGLVIKGWVANQLIEKMDFYDENLSYLKQQLDIPFMGEVKANQTIADVKFLNV